MATETLERKALDVGSILKVFEKALKSKHPERATDKIRTIVSNAEYDGTLDTYSLLTLSRETQKLVEKYGKKPYTSEN